MNLKRILGIWVLLLTDPHTCYDDFSKLSWKTLGGFIGSTLVISYLILILGANNFFFRNIFYVWKPDLYLIGAVSVLLKYSIFLAMAAISTAVIMTCSKIAGVRYDWKSALFSMVIVSCFLYLIYILFSYVFLAFLGKLLFEPKNPAGIKSTIYGILLAFSLAITSFPSLFPLYAYFYSENQKMALTHRLFIVLALIIAFSFLYWPLLEILWYQTGFTIII
ncbi:MAG: hypothetical protein V1835_00695 [Candidatus Micrarchaeota archaeon]